MPDQPAITVDFNRLARGGQVVVAASRIAGLRPGDSALLVDADGLELPGTLTEICDARAYFAI